MESFRPLTGKLVLILRHRKRGSIIMKESFRPLTGKLVLIRRRYVQETPLQRQ